MLDDKRARWRTPTLLAVCAKAALGVPGLGGVAVRCHQQPVRVEKLIGLAAALSTMLISAIIAAS